MKNYLLLCGPTRSFSTSQSQIFLQRTTSLGFREDFEQRILLHNDYGLKKPAIAGKLILFPIS